MNDENLTISKTLVIFTLISLGVICGILLLNGCAHTISPRPVVVRQIAFDKNSQTAGVIDCDKNGCLVTSGWIARYKAMEANLKQSFPADANIKPEGSNYRVSFEVQTHFAELRASERGP